MDYSNRIAVGRAVLDFIYQLPDGYANFPEHVLKLLNKLFGQQTLAFIPTYVSYADMGKLRPDYFVRDYVTLNVTPEQLGDYNRYYYDKDIFRHAGLPAELRRKPVICIEDIMPYDKFRQTEYYLFLQSNGTPHQVTINLNLGNVHLGAVCVYQSEEEGLFTADQIEVFETLSRFIVQHYDAAMKSSQRGTLLDLLSGELFRDLSIGVVVLDESYTVLEANAAAERYATRILKSGKTSYVVKTAQGDCRGFPKVQQVINDMGLSIFRRGESSNYYYGDCCYQFHTGSILSPNQSLSKMEALYVVFISLGSSEPSANRELFSELTAREIEIVSGLSRGLTNTQIAEEMHISVHTVKTHLLNIFKKQGVNSRTALLHKLHQHSELPM